MTNAEKYQEVFGVYPDPSMCPAEDCIYCPCNPSKGDPELCAGGSTYEFWNSEYKEVKHD